MAFVHFKGPYSTRTACGRSWKQASASTERPDQVTCPQCKESLARRREADKNLGNYTILDDMVGIAKIRRSENKGRPKKRLIETLEVMIAVPDVSHGIAVENMLAQWGGVPYAELSVMLVKLRHLAMVHQTHHWAAKGDPFYGDHLLYERLYNTIVEEIDALAEKSVGLGSEDNVNLPLQAMQLAQLTKEYGSAVTLPVASSLPQRSMAAEVDFLRCAALCACSLKEKGMMTRGLDNFLQGLEDKHESHVYLLKRRCGAGGQLSARQPAEQTPVEPGEQLAEKRVKKPAKKPRKVAPASLMKQVTSALSTLGYQVSSREKNMGALKAWMDLPAHLKPKRPVEPDTSLMSDEEFEKHLADKSAAQDAVMANPPKEKTPAQLAMKFKKALNAAGLETSVSGDNYETTLRGKGFDVIVPKGGRGDIGADLFIQVFAGKYAEEERMGIDTTDYMYGEGRLREYVEKPLAELEKLIAAMGPDDVADDDYVDSDSGEIYLEKDRKARTSQLHPEYVRDMQVRMAADREARRLEDEQWAKEDAEWEAEQDRSKQEAQAAFDAAVREYAGNWTDWRQSMGDEDTEEQSVAVDAADGFFYQFPEWKRWAAELGMKQADIKSMVADFVYEAIITGRTDF